MSWPAVKRAVSAADFPAYLRGLAGLTWKPQFLVLHNTANPTLAMRPNGFTAKNMDALENYYRREKGWPGGPHLFIDDNVIWVFNPLTRPGVHSPSWNKVSIGIEMLGDFEREPFTSGRGFRVRHNTVRAVAALSNALGLKPDGWRYHYEDKGTTHLCPGKNARLDRVNLVRDIASEMSNGSPTPWQFPLDDKEFE